MEFIEKHKALIITSMLMGIFVLTLYNINMVNKKMEQSEILMEIPEEIMEELMKEEEVEEPEPEEDRKLIASKRTHQSFNEDFDDSEDFEKRIKSLTETTETTAENSESNDLAEGQAAIDEEINKEEIIEDKKVEKPKSEDSNNRNSSSAYELEGRKIIGQIPNPIYTCNGSGKVVVKIEVNQNGYITDAKIDKRKSTTRNECLFDNALNYAREALFSSSDIKEQKGSITYYFNYGG